MPIQWGTVVSSDLSVEAPVKEIVATSRADTCSKSKGSDLAPGDYP